MIGIALAVALAAALVYGLSPAKPTMHRGQRQADLPRFFYSMIQYMNVGGVLHVQHEGSERLLRFRKVVLPGDRRGFTLELPDTPWSRTQVDAVRKALTAAGFQCTADEVPSNAGLVSIVTGLTALEAFRVAEITRNAVGLDVDATFTIHMEGYPSWSELRRSDWTRKPADV